MNAASPSLDSLDGKVALVTGAASGFGRAVATKLAAAGTKVLAADINMAGVTAVADEIGAVGISMDVSDFEANKAAVARAVDELGGLDLAFLNAGVSTGCGVGDDFDPALYRRAMGANLDGVIYGSHAAIAAMRRGGGGSIVATASLAGLTAVPYDPIYAANKHGVVGLVRSLGPGLIDEGIRVNAICPGFADTAIIDPIREGLAQSNIPVIPAETVADVVLAQFTGEMSGECWWIQPGRDSQPFGFRNLPGPRSE